jgi:hypothetical protein
VNRGSIELTFEVPVHCSGDTTNDHPIEIHLASLANARVAVTRVALEKVRPKRLLESALNLLGVSR